MSADGHAHRAEPTRRKRRCGSRPSCCWRGARARRTDQDVPRPGVLHPVGIDEARPGDQRPDPGAEGVVLGDGGPDRGDDRGRSRTRAAGWTANRRAATNNLAKGLAKVGLYPTGGHLVKRVIGVARRHRRSAATTGRASGINGVAIDEDDFIAPQNECDGPMPSGVPEGLGGRRCPRAELFVMGDNRAASADSSARLCEPKATATLRPRRGVRAGRPGRGQGVRAGLAARPLPVHRHAGRRSRTIPDPS